MYSKKIYSKGLISLSFILFLFSTAPAQQFNWAKRMGNAAFDFGYALDLDAAGNVYSTGSFSGTVDFDPGAGVYNLTPACAVSNDIFISKLDSGGHLIWAINAGGCYSDEARAIVTDASANIYITGTFNDTADFDPGAGVYNLVSAGNSDVFVAKYDSIGAFIWARNIGGDEHQYASAIDVDMAGNLYVTGDFRDTVDFDPGAGIFTMMTLGNNDIFILKLDADGNFIWAKDIGHTTYNYGYGIKTDAYGGVYTTGTYRQTVDFDPGVDTFNLTSTGYDDIFIYKSDTAGNFIWAKSVGGVSYDYGRSLAIDPTGNVWITGSFLSVVDFNPGSGVFNITQSGIAGGDIFILKLDSAGNFMWAGQMGGTGDGYGAAIEADIFGNIYTTGHFDGVTDFNPGSGVLNFTAAGLSGGDIYVVKLNAAGNLQWAKQVGGTSYDYGTSIVPDAAGNVYYAGFFYNTVDFDPGTGTYNLTSAGVNDIFVSKLGGTSTGVSENEIANIFALYPNPSDGIIHIDLLQEFPAVQVSVRNVIGEEVFSQHYSHTAKLELHLNTAPGIYFIQLITDDKLPVVIEYISK